MLFPWFTALFLLTQLPIFMFSLAGVLHYFTTCRLLDTECIICQNVCVLFCWWGETSALQVLNLVVKPGLYCNYNNPLRSFGPLWATSPPVVHVLSLSPLLSTPRLLIFLPTILSDCPSCTVLMPVLMSAWSKEQSHLLQPVFGCKCEYVCVCVKTLWSISKDKGWVAYSVLNKSWNLNNKVKSAFWSDATLSRTTSFIGAFWNL